MVTIDELKQIIAVRPVVVQNPNIRSERWLTYDSKFGDFYLETPFLDYSQRITNDEAVKLYENRPRISIEMFSGMREVERRDIILPIHPEYISLIMAGKKTIEVRKRVPQYPVGKIYQYETAPVSKIVGVMEVSKIEVFNGVNDVNDIKEQLKKACLTKDQFWKYVGSREKEIAFYYIQNPERFPKPIAISVVPQSLIYVTEKLKKEIGEQNE